MPRHLADRGLTLTRDWDADQYREQLLRPIHRELAVFEIERVAVGDAGPAGADVGQNRRVPAGNGRHPRAVT